MLDHLQQFVFPAAFSLLPPEMDTPAARAMLLCIALQESKCCHRRQLQGPARGFYQFEKGGGVRGVLTHAASKVHAQSAMTALQYSNWSTETAYEAIEHNDTLATVFARLLLWTLPDALPSATEPHAGWTIYIKAWRPGRPHVSTWDAHFEKAWSLVW